MPQLDGSSEDSTALKRLQPAASRDKLFGCFRSHHAGFGTVEATRQGERAPFARGGEPPTCRIAASETARRVAKEKSVQPLLSFTEPSTAGLLAPIVQPGGEIHVYLWNNEILVWRAFTNTHSPPSRRPGRDSGAVCDAVVLAH